MESNLSSTAIGNPYAAPETDLPGEYSLRAGLDYEVWDGKLYCRSDVRMADFCVFTGERPVVQKKTIRVKARKQASHPFGPSAILAIAALMLLSSLANSWPGAFPAGLFRHEFHRLGLILVVAFLSVPVWLRNRKSPVLSCTVGLSGKIARRNRLLRWLVPILVVLVSLVLSDFPLDPLWAFGLLFFLPLLLLASFTLTPNVQATQLPNGLIEITGLPRPALRELADPRRRDETHL